MFNKWEGIVYKMYDLGTLLMLYVGCEVPYSLHLGAQWVKFEDFILNMSLNFMLKSFFLSFLTVDYKGR